MTYIDPTSPANWPNVVSLVNMISGSPNGNYRVASSDPASQMLVLEHQTYAGNIRPLVIVVETDIHGDEWVMLHTYIGSWSEDIVLRAIRASGLPHLSRFGLYAAPDSIGLRWCGRTQVTSVDSVNLHAMEIVNMTEGMIEVLSGG